MKKLGLLLLSLLLVGALLLGNQDSKKDAKLVTSTKQQVQEYEKKQQNVLTKQQEKVKNEVLKYLEKKYEEKFVVEEVRVIDYGRGYEVIVYPKRKSEFSFIVRKLKMTGYRLADDYSTELWRYEAMNYLRPLIEDVAPKYELSAGISLKDNNGEFYEFVKSDMDFEEFLMERISRAKYNITVYFFKDITDENKEEILKAIYKTVIFIRERGFKRIDFKIRFFEEEYFQDMNIRQRMYELSKNTGMRSFSSFYRNFINYSLAIRDEKYEKLSNYKELDKYLYKWEEVYKNKLQNPKKPYKK